MLSLKLYMVHVSRYLQYTSSTTCTCTCNLLDFLFLFLFLRLFLFLLLSRSSSSSSSYSVILYLVYHSCYPVQKRQLIHCPIPSCLPVLLAKYPTNTDLFCPLPLSYTAKHPFFQNIMLNRSWVMYQLAILFH